MIKKNEMPPKNGFCVFPFFFVFFLHPQAHTKLTFQNQEEDFEEEEETKKKKKAGSGGRRRRTKEKRRRAARVSSPEQRKEEEEEKKRRRKEEAEPPGLVADLRTRIVLTKRWKTRDNGEEEGKRERTPSFEEE